MQSLIANYLSENLSSLTRKEIASQTNHFHSQPFSDASFSEHVSVYTIDATFEKDCVEATRFLTDTYSSAFRIRNVASPKQLELFETLLFYEDAVDLVTPGSVEEIIAFQQRTKRSHLFALYGAELLWSASVLELKSLFFSPSQLVTQAHKAFSRAAQSHEPAYVLLANNTEIYAQRLAETKQLYFQ